MDWIVWRSPFGSSKDHVSHNGSDTIGARSRVVPPLAPGMVGGFKVREGEGER